jgi:predicted nucleic-acid-binding protein
LIGLDSNVVIRYLTRDDERQFLAAERAILSAVEAGELIHLSIPVLMETVWVLQLAYAVDRRRIAEVLQAFLDLPAFVLEHEALVEAALDAFQSSSADFADCLIGFVNVGAGCRCTLTFDARAAKAPSFELLPPAS